MKTAVIISGGSLNSEFALDFLKKTPRDFLIGADKGICFFKEYGLIPTHIVGDFDSAAVEALAYFERIPGISIRKFQPEKDFTDSQIALELALELGAERIYLLGFSGTRLDHVAANIRILSIPLEKKAECFLLDANNRIRLIDGPLKIKREEQYGKYVSLFAFGGPVFGITLKGFYYLLTNYDMNCGDAVGTSNEIAAENGEIYFSSGKLLVIESKD